MRVLVVETSTLAGGVALLDGDVLAGHYVLDLRVTHSERLMVAVDRLLPDAGWTVRDLTGLRVGLSTVTRWAVARSRPAASRLPQ